MIKELNESEKIYYAIFQKKIAPVLKDHFSIVSKKIDSDYSEEEIREYYIYLSRVSDLEALELAGRYFKRLGLLTKKFQIMIYLAETVPDNYNYYINNKKNNIFHSCLSTGFYCVYTLYKIIKGTILLWIY